MSALNVRTEGPVVHLEGVLDETSPPELSKLAGQLRAQNKTVLEVSAVKRINSLGVRAWVDFMKQLEGRAITLRRCSPAFVDQLNSVSDFKSHATVESFLAPFVCEKTGNVFYEEFTVGKDIKSSADLAALANKRCKECPDPLVFDDLPERYLHFLAFC